MYRHYVSCYLFFRIYKIYWTEDLYLSICIYIQVVCETLNKPIELEEICIDIDIQLPREECRKESREECRYIYQYKKDYFRFQFLISTKLSNSIDPPIHGNKKNVSINSFYIWFLVLIYTTTTAVKLILSFQVTVKLLHYITAQFTLVPLIKTCIVIYSRLSDPIHVNWR